MACLQMMTTALTGDAQVKFAAGQRLDYGLFFALGMKWPFHYRSFDHVLRLHRHPEHTEHSCVHFKCCRQSRLQERERESSNEGYISLLLAPPWYIHDAPDNGSQINRPTVGMDISGITHVCFAWRQHAKPWEGRCCTGCKHALIHVCQVVLQSSFCEM